MIRTNIRFRPSDKSRVIMIKRFPRRYTINISCSRSATLSITVRIIHHGPSKSLVDETRKRLQSFLMCDWSCSSREHDRSGNSAKKGTCSTISKSVLQLVTISTTNLLNSSINSGSGHRYKTRFPDFCQSFAPLTSSSQGPSIFPTLVSLR